MAVPPLAATEAEIARSDRWFIAGGPLLNLVVGALTFGIGAIEELGWLQVCSYSCFVVGLVNLAPAQTANGGYSDGARLLVAWRGEAVRCSYLWMLRRVMAFAAAREEGDLEVAAQWLREVGPSTALTGEARAELCNMLAWDYVVRGGGDDIQEALAWCAEMRAHAPATPGRGDTYAAVLAAAGHADQALELHGWCMDQFDPNQMEAKHRAEVLAVRALCHLARGDFAHARHFHHLAMETCVDATMLAQPMLARSLTDDLVRAA